MLFLPHLHFEIDLWGAGLIHLAGIDEAGRGAWAGPVCAGAAVLPPDPSVASLLNGVRDSKLMTPPQRAEWAVELKAVALAWGVGFATHIEIDEMGILPATRLAMQRALEQLSLWPEHLLIDAVRLPLEVPQTSLIHGDTRSLSIAAASVLAKTAHDAVMLRLEKAFPGYGFGQHKGYGTGLHQDALARLGPCAVHRRSYAPVAALIPARF